MIIFKKVDHLKKYVAELQKNPIQIGFVPTMGALHEGHISLIRQCKSRNNLTICSIFINPAQFNNVQDFKKYPVTIEKDIELLENAGCDILFLPEVEQVYPHNSETKHYNLGYLENILEGKYRPGHFQGVCRVVNRLLDIVACQEMFLGEKDYQQCMVLKKMVELENIPVTITTVPTLRESSGLAMSSRNMRLTTGDKEMATTIYKVLKKVANEIQQKDYSVLQSEAIALLTEKGFAVDYVEIADGTTLLPVSRLSQKKVVLIAAALHDVRLIDNLVIQ